MTEEKLAEIEALLEGEPDYHCIMVGYEPHPAWALDVKAVRELMAIARMQLLRERIAEDVRKAASAKSWMSDEPGEDAGPAK